MSGDFSNIFLFIVSLDFSKKIHSNFSHLIFRRCRRSLISFWFHHWWLKDESEESGYLTRYQAAPHPPTNQSLPPLLPLWLCVCHSQPGRIIRASREKAPAGHVKRTAQRHSPSSASDPSPWNRRPHPSQRYVVNVYGRQLLPDWVCVCAGTPHPRIHGEGAGGTCQAQRQTQLTG